MTADLFGQHQAAEAAPLATEDDLVTLLYKVLDAVAALRQDLARAAYISGRQDQHD